MLLLWFTVTFGDVEMQEFSQPNSSYWSYQPRDAYKNMPSGQYIFRRRHLVEWFIQPANVKDHRQNRNRIKPKVERCGKPALGRQVCLWSFRDSSYYFTYLKGEYGSGQTYKQLKKTKSTHTIRPNMPYSDNIRKASTRTPHDLIQRLWDEGVSCFLRVGSEEGE